jgi:hypothetical protein
MRLLNLRRFGSHFNAIIYRRLLNLRRFGSHFNAIIYRRLLNLRRFGSHFNALTLLVTRDFLPYVVLVLTLTLLRD